MLPRLAHPPTLSAFIQSELGKIPGKLSEVNAVQARPKSELGGTQKEFSILHMSDTYCLQKLGNTTSNETKQFAPNI